MEVHAHAHTPRKKWTHYFWEFQRSSITQQKNKAISLIQYYKNKYHFE